METETQQIEVPPQSVFISAARGRPPIAPKKRIPLSQLLDAAIAAGAKDPPLVASCIAIGANANGIEQTIALWREKAPDLFTVVVDASRAGAAGRKGGGDSARRQHRS